MIDYLFKKINRYVPDKWKWILEHRGFKKYFANTGWMFIGRFINLAVNFFIGAYIARYLGPDKYGTMNYVISFCGIFTAFSSLGLEPVLMRDIVKARTEGESSVSALMSTAFVIKLVGSFVAIALTLMSALIFRNSAGTIWLMIIFLSSSPLGAFTVIDNYFKATIQAKKMVNIQIYSTIISVCVKLCIIWLDMGLNALMATFLIEAIYATIIYVRYYQRDARETIQLKYFSNKICMYLLKTTWPLTLTAVASTIYFRIDQVLLKYLLNDEMVGYYTVGVKLTEVWYFIPAALSSSFFPAVVSAHTLDPARFLRRIRKNYVFMTLMAVAAGLIITATARFLIINVFGSEYEPAVNVLRIYGWSVVGYFLNVATSNYLMAENYTRISFFTNLFGMILNIVLNILWIPKFGIYGAAWATSVSYVFTVVSLVFFKQPREHFKKVFSKSYGQAQIS